MARGSTAMQFTPTEVYDGAVPPSNPAPGQLWRNTGVNPNELVAWRGLAVSNARSYATSKNGQGVQIDDMADNNRNLFFQVKTIASQMLSTQGKNICPHAIGEWESGQYDPTTGAKVVNAARARLNRLVRVTPSTTYYCHAFTNPYSFVFRAYDVNGVFVRSIGAPANGATFVTAANEYYIGISLMNGTSETGMTWATWQSLFSAGTVKPFVCLNSEADKTYAAFTPSMPSAEYPAPIIGKDAVVVKRRGKNLASGALTNETKNGVTATYDPADQSITFNGTCTTNNTGFNIPMPQQINSAHTVSVHFVSGTRTPVGSNGWQGYEAGWVNGFFVFMPSSGFNRQYMSGARVYANCNIRIDAGTVLTNYKIKLQIELGDVATPVFEAYSGTDYTLTPQTTLYGLTGAEDRINTSGYTGLYAYYSVFTSANTLMDAGIQAGLTGVFRFKPVGLTAGLAPANNNTVGNVISSHFPPKTANETYLGNIGISLDSSGVPLITVALSTIGAVDADSTATKIAKVKAWLDTQTMQVLYQRATTYFYPQVAVTSPLGINGVNVVTSDGANVTVNYTGSGWETLGAVQRIKINTFSLDPETGMRIDQYMDGAQAKTYFLADANDLGFYATYDGKRFAGIGYDDTTNEGYLEVTQLRHPDAPEGHRFRMAIRNMGVHAYLASVSALLSFYNGEETGGVFSYIDDSDRRHYEMFARGQWHITSRPPAGDYAGGNLRSGYFMETGYAQPRQGVFSEGAFLPELDNEYVLGYTGYRWKKFYAASSTISTSDERLKHDIRPADPEMMRKFIMALDAEWFRLNGLDDEQMVGFIAQKFRKAMQLAGMPDDFGGYVDELPDHSRLGVRYEQVIAPLAAMAKLHEQENRERDKVIEEQGSQLKAQGSEITELKRMLDELIRRIG